MVEATALVLVVALALAVPHALPLERVRPGAACAVWLAALVLRALLALGLALTALLVLPATAMFHRVTGWSAYEIVGSVHVSGEPIAHSAALGPALLVVLSLLAFAVALARGSLALRRELARRALGAGPRGSVVIADRALLVAVPGLGRRRIVLSDRALAELDPAELDACLGHEAGHLRRGHRGLGLLGACLAAIGRPLPGARAALRGLRLSLERDADEYAVARTGDPLALASAICKVARGPGSAVGRGVAAVGLAGGEGGAAPAGLTRRAGGAAAVGLTGGGGVRARLDCLLAGGRRRGSAALERAVLGLALLLCALAAATAAGVAVWLATDAPVATVSAALTCG